MRKKMTRQERSSDISDDIQAKMGLNSQGKNIYLQLYPDFHLTAAAAAAPLSEGVTKTAVYLSWIEQTGKLNAYRATAYLEK